MVGLYYITLLSLLNFSNLEEGNLDKKNDKDEIGYILLKHVFTCL
jgi:hypothetical protein